MDSAVAMHQTTLAAARQVGDRPRLGPGADAIVRSTLHDQRLSGCRSHFAAGTGAVLPPGRPGIGQADAINRLGFMYRLSGDYRGSEESPCGPSPGLGGLQRGVS